MFKRNVARFALAALVGGTWAQSAVLGEQIWHVDGGASGPAHDGTSWCQGFQTLQAALDVAASGDVIRVAAGIYRPDSAGLANPRNATFHLLDGVSLKGGFAGCGAVDPEARDFVAHATVLSGDLNGDDGPNFTGYAENCFHVVTHSNPDATNVLLEGFTISGGYANGHDGFTNQGGGIHIRQGLIKCLRGGPTIRHCIVEKNWSSHHGAINDHGLSTVIEDCVIRGNYSGGEGGGLQIHSGSPTITNCTFLNNISVGNGGGAWVGTDTDASCTGASTATFTNCVFDGNSADLGGGLYTAAQTTPTVSGCTFIRNTAGRDGAGMYSESVSDAVVRESQFVTNVAEGQGGGVYNVGNSPTFTDCIFRGNTAGIYAGAMRNLESHPVLTGCTFVNNSTAGNGGALHNRLGGLTLDRCAFFGNSAAVDGGAVFNIEDCNAVLKNSLFTGNFARIGGAVTTREGSISRLFNCTLHANSASRSGGGLDTDFQSQAWLTNCIVWNHPSGTYSGLGTTKAAYSNIEGGQTGEGNINVPPWFVDAEGADNVMGTEDDDLRLNLGAAGINRGDPGFVLTPAEHDLAGGPRLVECRVDMGAHEASALQARGDFNYDRAVNLADFASFQLCAFNNSQHAAWRETCLCVFDFDRSDFVDLADFASLPWDLRPCNEEEEGFCDDGEPCNGMEECVAGWCQMGTPVDCNDGNTCTNDACDGGICRRTNNTVLCDDNDACSVNDRCHEGVCEGNAVECDDGNPCTDDTCDPESGCIFSDDDANSCNDGNACNGAERCVSGNCLAGTALTCNDNKPCTDDSCVPMTGCRYANDDTNVCDDGNPCTINEVCVGGECEVGLPVDCSNLSSPCRTASCDPAGVPGNCDAVAMVPDGTDCDDGNACTLEDSCSKGECAGSALHCDDGNPCTDDSCDASGECVFTDDDTNPCDDGNACTSSDSCSGGKCTGGPALECDDGNPCTAGDACVSGACQSGAVVDCSAFEGPCRTASCDPEGAEGNCDALSFLPDGTNCNDGDDCTMLDRCNDGICERRIRLPNCP